MRKRFYLGKFLRHRESSTPLVRLCLPISSAFVSGIRQFLVQIPIMDKVLIGYWVAGQVRNMMSRVMYKSKFMMGNMILRRVLMIPCGIFLRDHVRNIRRIALIGICRGRVGGLGGAF